jgi:hypothetical protein
MSDGPLWIVQGIATDGLRPPRQAVKLEIFREEEPDIQFLKWFEAQCSGIYRVQYGDWSAARPFARFRAQHEPDTWITVSDIYKEGSGEGVGS